VSQVPGSMPRQHLFTRVASVNSTRCRSRYSRQRTCDMHLHRQCPSLDEQQRSVDCAVVDVQPSGDKCLDNAIVNFLIIRIIIISKDLCRSVRRCSDTGDDVRNMQSNCATFRL